MMFNDPDPTTKKGLVQDAYYEVKANTVSYPIADVVRNANNGLDTVVTLILGADGKWQFDDTNATDLPIGSTDIISGQQDYSFDEEYLVIKSIEISDQYGNWRRLIPLDNDDLLKTQALSALDLQSGNPTHYDKMGESIILYPIPNYNLRLDEEGTAGIRAYFQRKISYFEITDTDKEPGFAKHLHKYISLCIQKGYAKANGLPKLAQIEKEMMVFEGNKHLGGTDPGAIASFYSYRELDRRPIIKNNTYVKR